MAEFFHMGGYAAYVWPAYGLAAVVMGGILFASLRRLRSQEQDLEQMQQLRPRRSRRDAQPASPEVSAP